MYRRQVKRTTETLKKKKAYKQKKKKRQVKPGLPHLILYLLQPFCTILSGALLKKKSLKNHASAFQSLRSASFSMPAIRTHETSHMGGDVFVIHTLKSKAVVSYFFSSVTQARIITVQLLARVAAAGRMASVVLSAR